MEKQTLPNSTLILVFGILSIITCWCYGIIGIILGVIAIILASKATKEYKENPELYNGYGNVTAGRVMAIIGVVLSILMIILFIWVIVVFGMEALQNPELMQERMDELNRR